MATVDACPTCGFVWDDVGDDEIAPRLRAGTSGFASLLADPDAPVGHRPAPDVWSASEYAGHVRDVLLVIRDRVVLALVQDDPSFSMLHPDQRVELGLYAADDPERLATDLTVATDLLLRFLAPLTAEQLARPCQYAWPEPATRSIRWMAQQAVHEVEHHLDDALRGLAPAD